ncbi:MAG: hypothetical protein ACTSVI_14985 [Promethearchaeota archaeon]
MNVPSKSTRVASLWDEEGLHKPLAQFWWNYVIIIFQAIILLIFTSILIPNVLLPFPEVFGFYGIITSLFTLLFTILNNGTSEVVTRYVSEHAVDKPEKTLEYIRFFVWFQMITGLFQVTGIAIFALYFMPPNLEFMTWCFIIYSTIQYPGMLTIYQACLNGFQRFDKSNKLGILQVALIQPGMLILWILIGKTVGGLIPSYGEIMGSLIGYVIGNYLDDFITFTASAYMFKPILKKIGYSIIDTMIPRVSREVIKNALFFGTRIMITGMFYQLVYFSANLMIIAWVPQYGTILGIYGVAKGICDISLMQLPMTPLFSESYNHSKYSLYNYAIKFQMKYFGMIPGFLAIEIGMLFPVVLSTIIGGNYTLAAYIIPVLLPIRFTALGCRYIDQLQIGADKPNQFIITRIVEQVTRFFAHLFLLHPKLIPSLVPSHVTLSYLGGTPMDVPIFFVLYSFCDFPGMIAKNIFGFWLVDKKILKPVGEKLEFPWWQMVGAMSLVFIVMIGVNWILVQVFIGISTIGILAAFGMTILYLMLMMFGLPLVIFLLYSYFGGWDDFGLSIFHKAVMLSGPSRFYVRVIYKLSKIGHEHSPIKNKFPIPHEDAEREVDELNLLKKIAYNTRTTNNPK